MSIEKELLTQNPAHKERLGFRLDEQTKGLIERAAHLESRKVTDFCVAALTDAARRTIAAHETLVLSDLDRKVFFDTLMSPPQASERLVRALKEHKRRIIS
jgi:uncharacterized protein (DUF1778 family)